MSNLVPTACVAYAYFYALKHTQFIGCSGTETEYNILGGGGGEGGLICTICSTGACSAEAPGEASIL